MGRTRIPLPALAVSSVVLVTTAVAFVFFVAPNDQSLGFSQRIFYFHVPSAYAAYSLTLIHNRLSRRRGY